MKNSSLRRELLWFVFAIGAAVLALGVWDAWERRAEMVAQRKTELRHVLDLASSIVQNGKRGVREGLTLEQAQRNVAQRLAQLRYGADGYVGAFRDDYSLLVHPDSKLVGTNVRDTRDAEGRPIFEDLYAQGRPAAAMSITCFRVRDRTKPCTRSAMRFMNPNGAGCCSPGCTSMTWTRHSALRCGARAA